MACAPSGSGNPPTTIVGKPETKKARKPWPGVSALPPSIVIGAASPDASTVVLLNTRGKSLARTIVEFSALVKTPGSNAIDIPGTVGTPVEPVIRLAATMQSRSVITPAFAPPHDAESTAMTFALASSGSSVAELTMQVAACVSIAIVIPAMQESTRTQRLL